MNCHDALTCLRCIVVSQELEVQDLLSLRTTCRPFCQELTGSLPGHHQYRLSRGTPKGYAKRGFGRQVVAGHLPECSTKARLWRVLTPGLLLHRF